MKIGIFGDVHSNIFALEALLKKMSDCDQYVCLGDISNWGGNPNECFARVRALPGIRTVRGNHDGYLLCERDGFDYDEPRKEKRAYFGHMQNLTSQNNLNYLDGIPKIITERYDGFVVSYVHFAWKDEYNTVDVPQLPISDVNLKSIFSNVEGDMVFFAHTHCAQDSAVEGKRYINLGSLGTPGKGEPIARGAVLNVIHGKADVAYVEARYDKVAAVRALEAISDPLISEIEEIFYGEKIDELF